jgi:hypothetical protein
LLHANIAPSEYRQIRASSGIKGLSFNYSIRQDEGSAELYINQGSEEANKRIFDRLYIQRAEIEQVFGGELSWERLDNKEASRITCLTPIGGYRNDISQWPIIQDAMIDAMVRLEKALNPHLGRLKAEL